jgi:hypothetical protein
MDSERTDLPNSPQLICRRCGRELHPGRGDHYVVSILSIADPSPPVFNEDDLARDVEHEIQQLLVQLKTVETHEAEDQVFRRLVFHLCESCHRNWIMNPTGR